MKTLLEFVGVDAHYGAAHILHGVTLGVDEGERVAVLGRNGVGKTTLVNTLLAAASLRGGEIRLRGERIRKLAGHTAAAHGVAIVPQGRKILPNLSIQDNLKLGAALRRPGPWDLRAVYALFPVLAERRSVSGTALSGGQQQMLAIGRALMANPDLLILDEPSEGLAPIIVDELGRVLARLADTGVSILLIEQHLRLARDLSERFYVMSKGSITNAGLMKDVDLEQLQSTIMN
ncbi:MAG: ABC transporter ATP-binding protein [Nitratireductor sp.]|uniref:ABC transporter ATP-binding protein n=1 Tax=Thalassobaculum sp. TaxID=2022740 RepID=UPI0032EC6024